MFSKALDQKLAGQSATSSGIVLDGCTIQSVVRGSPAFFSEVDLIGQTITEVDRKAADAKTLPDLLKGNDVAGEKLTLKLASGQEVVLVRDSAPAMQARASVYEEIAEDEKGKRLLSLIEPFLKCDPWRSAQSSANDTGSSEMPPSRSLMELKSQLDKANEKLSQSEMLQQRMTALETQLKDARTTLSQRSQSAKTGPEVEHLRRCNKALQTTLDSLLTVGESVTVSSPVIAQAQDVPLSPQKVHFALTLPSESGIRMVEHDAKVHKCDYCEMNDHIVGKWKVLRRAFVQQQLDHAAEIDEATRSLLRLRECLVKMQPRPDAGADGIEDPPPVMPRADLLGAQV